MDHSFIAYFLKLPIIYKRSKSTYIKNKYHTRNIALAP